jgi:hypothetical protein
MECMSLSSKEINEGGSSLEIVHLTMPFVYLWELLVVSEFLDWTNVIVAWDLQKIAFVCYVCVTLHPFACVGYS